MANTTGKKFGGRRKGSLNKDNRILREKIDELLAGNWEQVLEDLKTLKPKERLDIYARLLEYSLPKMSRVEVTGEIEEVPLSLEEMQERYTKLMGEVKVEIEGNDPDLTPG